MPHKSIVVYLVKKKVNGNIYLYLNKKARVDGKSKVVWQQYLGPEKNIEKLSENIAVYLKNYEPKVHNFGLPLVLMEIANRLNLVKIIDQVAGKRNQGFSVGEYVLISAINRAVKPTSKAKIRKWFDSTQLQKQLPKIDTYLNSNAYTNHFEYLTEEKINRIELELNKIMISEFKLDMSNVFYDPTNYYTFINPRNPEKQELPRHGNSKEGRKTLNLISLSLFCTQDGIPLMHQTYPGNIQDATHFKTEFPKFIERMSAIEVDNSSLTLIFDKGNISEKAFHEIETSNINFICSVRPSSHKDLEAIKGEDFEIFTLPNGNKVGLKEFSREMHGNRYILIVAYNPNKNKWSRSIKFEKIEKKVKAVQEYFEARLNLKKWRDKENVSNKIKAIIKNKEYFSYINYEVEGEYGKLSYHIEVKPNVLEEHLDTLGKSYYMTNRSDLTPKQTIWLYRQQYTVEHAFKLLKKTNFIQIRPMYHHKDSSILGHVFTVVLSLLLTSLLHKEVRNKFPKLSFLEMMEYLSEIETVSLEMPNKTITKMVTMSSQAKKLANHFKLHQYL